MPGLMRLGSITSKLAFFLYYRINWHSYALAVSPIERETYQLISFDTLLFIKLFNSSKTIFHAHQVFQDFFPQTLFRFQNNLDEGSHHTYCYKYGKWDG